MHIGAPLHWLLFTHWLFREQPLQHWLHSHGVSAGFGPQPAVVRLFLQQKPPTQLELPQHSGVQLQLCPLEREHAAAMQTLFVQLCPHAHAPPHVTVRIVPQLSGAVSEPQFFCSRVQKSGFVSAVQTHWPLPLQVRLGAVVHVPQLVTVRITPQLSGAVSAPHTRLWREQNVPSLSGMQAHTLVAEHVCGIVQEPQLGTVRITPQLSGAVSWPQFFDCRLQKVGLSSGTQPGQTLGVVAPQLPMLQVPQLGTVRMTPQTSAAVSWPQFFPSRVHSALSLSDAQRHRPASQEVPASRHAPQVACRGAPQLSFPIASPHSTCSRAQKPAFDSGAQPQTFATPAPPQVREPVQVPQLTVRERPQVSTPVTLSQSFCRRRQNAVFVSLVQPGVPQRPGIPPPPHVAGIEQEPQSATERETPHRSIPVAGPQVLPWLAQSAASLSGTQAPPSLPPPAVPPPPLPPAVPPAPLPPVAPPPAEEPSPVHTPRSHCWPARQSLAVAHRPRVSTTSEHATPASSAATKTARGAERSTGEVYSACPPWDGATATTPDTGSPCPPGAQTRSIRPTPAG